MSSGALRRVRIVADESADWKIAGLRQIDRLLLSIEEYARCDGERIIHVEIASDAATQHPLPHLRMSFPDAAASDADLELSTRLLFRRGRFPDGARLVQSRDDIPASERWLLRESGKSQDGFVSRVLNRPISRAVTRMLLRLPITPTAWTLLIFVLPLIAAVLFVRGSYSAVIGGMLLFQLYSILDGCDGEIARAKFAESARGRQIDSWCDTIAMILLVGSLGVGIGRATEGCVAALLTAINELWLLARSPEDPSATGPLYARHRALLQQAGAPHRSETLINLLAQVTKRDVAILLFVMLALAGRPEWILHAVAAFQIALLCLNVKAFTSGRRR